MWNFGAFAFDAVHDTRLMPSSAIGHLGRSHFDQSSAAGTSFAKTGFWVNFSSKLLSMLLYMSKYSLYPGEFFDLAR